ncbi:hypothetical protein [Mycobacterium celatum]|uniref:hypothetical protein n=1 Tax=Mycobacterium celatum TaxID=28045 RepID=UPI000AACC5DE|nr:hypothetical protein [Mycobacterium celatum]
MAPEGEHFIPWNESLDHSMHKVFHGYVKHYDDLERWMYSAYLQLTDTGQELARSIEDKDIQGYR